jgi:hypothetical protein
MHRGIGAEGVYGDFRGVEPGEGIPEDWGN